MLSKVREKGTAFIPVILASALVSILVVAILPVLSDLIGTNSVARATTLLEDAGYVVLPGTAETDLVAIRERTDNLPNSPADEVTSEAILESVGEIHDHDRNIERWLGSVAGWNGSDEVNAASNDRMEVFIIDAGNDTWGTPLCILGSGDTPILAGKESFDIHRIVVSATESNVRYRLRLAWGTSYAAAISANDFTEIEFMPTSNQADNGPANLIVDQIAVGTKIFAAVWAIGQNTSTISFNYGILEYNFSAE